MVVLAGDHKQLGPIVFDKIAAKSGLEVSLMERLMDMEPYKKQNGEYNPTIVTKLMINYRSDGKTIFF